jgi:NADH dehydrogenase
MLSPPAMQEGRYVGRIIRAGESAVERQPPFRYRDKGTMATIGRRAAVAQIGPLRLRGFLGWVSWLVVHLYYLIGFRNRLVVLASWSWDYLRRDRPIRLIVRSDYDPVMATLMSEAGAYAPPPRPAGEVVPRSRASTMQISDRSRAASTSPYSRPSRARLGRQTLPAHGWVRRR